MKRDHLVLGFVAVILLILVYSNIKNNLRHQEFYSDLTAFKSKGGRNTAAMGLNVCERLNELELMHDREPADCKVIYE